jgi:hypothetical protein
MRRDVRILMGTLALGGAVAWGPHIPAALRDMEAFRIVDVEVRGLRYLTSDDVVTRLGLTPEASVWADTDVWAERVGAHPLVRSVQVSRRVPDGLLVAVAEREPIALAPTPTLEPVDAEGFRLPLDPALYRLDLPVISTRRTPPPGSRLLPEDVRALAAEVGHLLDSDAAFVQRVSSVRWGEHGEIVARWTEPKVEFLLPRSVSTGTLRQGTAALDDELSRMPGDPPDVIDLRFADQVVVRRTRE